MPGPSDPIPGALTGQLLEVVNTPVFLHKLLVSPDDRTLIALGTRTILAFDLTQSTSASFARAKRRPARARTAIAARVRSAPASVAMPRVLWR